MSGRGGGQNEMNGLWEMSGGGGGQRLGWGKGGGGGGGGARQGLGVVIS